MKPVRFLPQRFTRPALLLLLLCAAFALGTAWRDSRPTPSDSYFEVSKNIDIFGRIMREVQQSYVDEVEINQFSRYGFDAMLKTLDPYTDFYSASQIEQYRFLNAEERGNPGLDFRLLDGKVIITEVFEGGPADKAGLKAGDQILQIDREKVEEKPGTAQRIDGLLAGEVRSIATLKVRRAGTPQPLEVKLERADRNAANIDFYTLTGPNRDIAYVSFPNGFYRNATAEIQKALEELRKQNPQLKGYILDLRGNPGGLLMEALALSNLFIPTGERIVETRGRMEGNTATYTAERPPFDTETPLAVLVDSGSASASEIVSGVVQDYDRGVVIGRRTYGKGLVQTTRPLSYNSQIKITTARYYTPSGRCIQAIDYTHQDAEGGLVRKSENQQRTFKTRRGRPVKDGGGIEPDLPTEGLALHPFTRALLSRHILFDFVTQWVAARSSAPDAAAFRVDDALYAEFAAYVQKRAAEITPSGSKELAALKAALVAETWGTELAQDVAQLENKLKAAALKGVQTYRPELAEQLRREIVLRYHYRKGMRQSSLDVDPDVQAAIRVLNTPTEYRALLSPKK